MYKKVAQYNEIKSSFDDLKSKGVTKEIIQAIHADEHCRNPKEYHSISAMEDEIMVYDQEQIEVLIEQRKQQLALQRQEIRLETADKGIEH